ncbi:MAG: tRNA (adenosine(37)-N6)-dimethylallyltransferase MiaA [Deltaproteobacteria bacterium]|jgi:tRNA dimethylallyltransferase|nr:tRNA (adenosine(37)-N6)-dimethylallyltransferase MiaA [Deltaproteobacteria bacterium]
MPERPEPVLVIAGPTATGKTAAALALAQHFEGELVGADSVQVYRGFDIGSAKPTPEELGSVKHHLIDIIDPDEDIDAAEYARRADEAIASVRARGRLPIIVGGTGLWIRALLRGLVDLPPVDPEIRRGLEEAVHVEGAAALHHRLAEVDAQTAEAVHPNDALRIVRALEVYEQTGTPLGTLRAEHALGAPRYQAFFVALDMERAAHAAVIDRRAEHMIAGGWVEELRTIRTRWGDAVRPLGSVGYRQILAHLRDGVPLDETLRQIRKATRVYARRQRTWFKGEPGVSWRGERAELLRRRSLERMARDLRL